MSADEYELLPHEELQKLREEVEELKKNPMGNVEESQDLKTAMAKMTKAMYQLIDILTQTNDEMVHEFQRSSMSKHFQKISDQNEAIAQALLGMAQLQEHHTQSNQVVNTPYGEPGAVSPTQQSPIGAPQQALGADNIPGAMAPPINQTLSADPVAQPQQNTNPLDLPPPEHHKKKGLGGLFK